MSMKRTSSPVVKTTPTRAGVSTEVQHAGVQDATARSQARDGATTTGFELELKLLEGRNFPRVSPGHAIAFHCLLNDVKQLVPPVVLERSSVRLNARIVWTFDTETLQHLRETNSTVNLECFLVDARSTSQAIERAGKSLGYCVLDIRAALQPTPGTAAATSKPEWYTLLPPGKKARGQSLKPLLRPEVRLFFKFVATRINVVQPEQGGTGSSANAATATSRGGHISKAPLHATRSVPATRIGDGNEDFTMTVSLVKTDFLTKLPRLGNAKKVMTTSGRKEERTDVYFYYSFLGRDLMTPPVLLHQLVPSERSRDTLLLPANHTVFHIQSSTTDMANFINSQSPLRIFVCTGEDVIGVVDVPLTNLVSGESFRDVECATTIQCVVTENDTKRGVAKDLVFKTLEAQPPYPTLHTHIGVVRNPSAQPHLIGPYRLQVRFTSLLLSERLHMKGQTESVQLHLQYADSVSFHSKPLALPERAESDHAAWVLDEVFEIDLTNVEAEGHDILNYMLERPIRFQLVSGSGQEYQEHGTGSYKFDKEEFDIPPFPRSAPRSHIPLQVSETIFVVDQEHNRIGECGIELSLLASDVHKATDEPVRSSIGALSRSILDPRAERGPSVLSHHPEEQRHFRVSIDLRTIKDIKMHAANIFLRYSYPEFGSVRPVMTQPPVEVHKHSEVRLPRSFCAFEFAMSGQQVRSTMGSIPLNVEVWHKDRYVKDMLLGSALVDLSRVLDDSFATHSGSSEHPVQTYDSYYNVMSEGGKDIQAGKVGEVRVILTFEDLGALDSGHPGLKNPYTGEVEHRHTATSSSGHADHHHHHHHHHDQHRHLEHSSSPKESHEPPREISTRTHIPGQFGSHVDVQQAAAEVESWKEAEMLSFEKNLQRLEAHRMDQIEKEWRRRERQREAMFEKRQSEYNKLEAHLRKAVAELEDRERRVVLAEDELKSEAVKIRSDADRKVADSQAVTRRTREEFAHQIALERKRYAELERTNKHKTDQLTKAEQRIDTLTEEIAKLRLSMHDTPTAKLQTEVARLRGEKVEIERKLSDTNAEKERFRAQCNRYARQVLQLQRDVREVEAKRLEHEKRDIDQMRLFYLARQETATMKGDTQEFEQIKQELEQFKRTSTFNTAAPPATMTAPQPTTTAATQLSRPPVSTMQAHAPVSWQDLSNTSNELKRLQHEREALLSTGAYTQGDALIRELDGAIADCQSQLSAHARPGVDAHVR